VNSSANTIRQTKIDSTETIPSIDVQFVAGTLVLMTPEGKKGGSCHTATLPVKTLKTG
jgi:hypothetical protein